MRALISIVFIIVIFLAAITPSLARSGCCSWHGGVRADGCGCNDGTPLSSTCAPYYTCTYSVPVYQYNSPTPIPPTYTPIPTNEPLPTNTPIPTLTTKPTNEPTVTDSPTIIPTSTLPVQNDSTTPTSNSENTTQGVAGVSTSADNNPVPTILSLLLLSGLIGGIYFKNKKEKS